MTKIFVSTMALFLSQALLAEELTIPFPREASLRRFELRLEEGATATRLEVRAEGAKVALVALEILPDKEGRSLGIRAVAGGQKKLVERSTLVFWPEEKLAKGLERLGLTPASWRGHPIPGLLKLERGRLQLWLEGRLVLNQAFERVPAPSLSITPGKGSAFSWKTRENLPTSLFETVELAHLIGTVDAREDVRTEDKIPFKVWDQGHSMLSLRNAGWPEWKSDPGSFIEGYDNSSLLYWNEKGALSIANVPRTDYVAAYLLATSDDDPGTSNLVTLRAGRRGAQVLYRDFSASVPRDKKGALKVIRIPFDDAFAQDVEGGTIDLEMTKEIRLARRSPDPCRFRWRPLGLPSGVKIAAVTLEKSPVQMEVRPREPGGLFQLPARPAFKVRLTNITGELQECTVRAEAVRQPLGEPRGDKRQHAVFAEAKCRIRAGDTVEEALVLPPVPPGYFRLAVSLSTPSTGPLLTYRTSFGVLPAAERKYRAEAPWGTWTFGGDHFTPEDTAEVGEVMRKLGLRYGLFKASQAVRDEFGIVKGNEFKVVTASKDPDQTPQHYLDALAKDPGYTADLMLFHEDAISGSHATRIPDCFSDRPPYRLNAEEKERFARMFETAKSAAMAMRAKFPAVKIHLGNGGLPLREEFYRAKFPADCFDTAGNEAAAFGRPPETQPPDIIANNATLWMDRQMLDTYGYGDKQLSQCYEVIYPSTNPGNLSLQTQADYFVRHVLHSMAWKIPKIRFGGIADVGNSYYYSNWGACGLMTAKPEWAPKPAAIAVATLTRELDGAAYQDFLETGSDSVYLLRFLKKDKSSVVPFWVVRGERELRLRVTGAAGARLTSEGGESRELPVSAGTISVTATASPAWLSLPPGAVIENISLGAPRYPDSEPKGKVAVLSSFGSLDGWKIAPDRNPLLEYYNPLTPRRMGHFAVKPVEKFEGTGPALRITPQPSEGGKATIPMYMELVSDRGVPLPGRPAEIGLKVNGNSGWGRIILELEDASGQRWTSIGAKAEKGSQWMADWLGSEGSTRYQPGEISDWNTDDVFGLSRINFDGWRRISIPLPGQYPGEGFKWPANSQWRSDKDGVVHYPLVLRKVIVEMPEKTLYLTRFEPAKRREIYLGELTCVERDMDAFKPSAREYVEEAQLEVR